MGKKLNKSHFDKELRSFYIPGILVSRLISRMWGIRLMSFLMSRGRGKSIRGIQCEEAYIRGIGGKNVIRIRIFKPKGLEGNVPGMLYLHGGGYMLSIPENSLNVIRRFIQTRPCVIIAPDYRKSIKYPYPAGFNDCYDTLLWMKQQAAFLNIFPSNFILCGHSAGGGLTSAISLKARDTKDIDIAFQMPLYPMLDHRQQTESAKTFRNVPVWNSIINQIAWDLYLRDIQPEVPAYASPALNENFTGIPPTMTFVSDTEPFRDETIEYVKNLEKAGIPVRFKIYKGAFHAFETMVKRAAISKAATDFMLGVFAEYYDTYTKNKL